MSGESKLSLARRLFLTRLGAGVSVLGAAAATAATAGAAAVQSVEPAAWQPARHMLDDWFDQVPGKHRLVFDTTTPEGASSALLYAGNFLQANKTGYNLQDSDMAVVIVMRHNSTPFAYNDSIWAKYGTPISSQANNFVDPKTKMPPTTNVYNGSGRGGSLDALLKRGVHLAVCQMATRAFAGTIARAVMGNTDDIYNELVGNLLENSHMVPAGIVAVSRAQERGYTFVHAV
jgi:intracellular sulfur oxidation DsrE/DsrF family protein